MDHKIVTEISGRLCELASLNLVLEELFMHTPNLKIQGEIFDGVSLFAMQRRLCQELIDLNSQLEKDH